MNLEQIVQGSAAALDAVFVQLQSSAPDLPEPALVKARNACAMICGSALDAAAQPSKSAAAVRSVPDRLCTRSASLAPTTADPKTRTVRATVSTGAAVPGKDAAGPFLEILDLAGVAPADLVGVPVLDRHRQDSVDRVLGVVTAAGRDAGGLWADIQVSARAEGVWQDVLAGVLRGVSVGYSVMAWQEGRTPRPAPGPRPRPRGKFRKSPWFQFRPIRPPLSERKEHHQCRTI